MRSDKATENREKNVLEEFLKSSTRSKHFVLETRQNVMTWMSKCESIKDTLKKSGVSDWKNQLLNVGKG